MLTTCPECELPVSDKAITCPHCGYPLQNQISKNPTREKSHMRLPNGFGQITKLKGRNLRNPYRAMVTVGKTDEGKPISKILKPQGYFKTYNEAYIALVEYNKNPYELDSEITVEELYEKWTKEYFATITPSTTRSTKMAWSNCSEIKNMRVRDIRTRHIKACIENVESESTKSRIKSMFNLMLDYALEYELVDRNYARDFKVDAPETKTDHIAFTDEEISILWRNTSTPFVNYILIQCYTGWRPQELCNLKLSNINLDEWLMVGGMKTKSGINRTVPIHERIQSMTKKIYSMCINFGSEYFVVDGSGTKMTYDMYYKKYKAVIKELGLNEDHRPHDPRKHFVTQAKASGVDEYAIKRLIGHTITDLTEDRYTERNIEWLREEIAKIK